MRTTSQWNLDWAFYADPQCRETLPAGALPWQPVTLPHDWQIWHVKELYQDGTGWYRKVFSYTPPGSASACTSRVYIWTLRFSSTASR